MKYASVIHDCSTIPIGLANGWVHWDDEDLYNDNNLGGEVPTGYYDHNTNIDFCCATSGFATNPIYLPVDDNFILFKYNHQCQEVRVYSRLLSSQNVPQFLKWRTIMRYQRATLTTTPIYFCCATSGFSTNPI